MAYSVRYYCTSNIGKKRSVNQDNFFCLGEFMQADNCGTDGILSGEIKCKKPSVFAVFDGIGGGVRGEVSAHIAAKCASETEFSRKWDKSLNGFCLEANKRICDFADDNGINSTGTTAAMLLFEWRKIHLCNIGDSKVFRIRKDEMLQLSKDHVSLSPGNGRKGVLAQYLGIPESEFTITPYIEKMPYKKGDIYLICSDGLTDMVESDDIIGTLKENDGEAAAGLLLEKALENGGKDNITFILLYILR